MRAHGEDLGNPLKLRRPLGAGVRVVVAHCASLGVGRDLDRGGSAVAANFDMFARLMDDPQFGATLAGDISAVAQGNRMDVVATLIERRDWHPRRLNGSDHNVLLFDFVLKRSLVNNGAGFACSVFETRPYFLPSA